MIFQIEVWIKLNRLNRSDDGRIGRKLDFEINYFLIFAINFKFKRLQYIMK